MRCVSHRGLLLVGVVFDQKARDCGGQAFLTGLERETDLRARFLLLAGCCEGEDAIERVPELRYRDREIAALTAKLRGRGFLRARERHPNRRGCV